MTTATKAEKEWTAEEVRELRNRLGLTRAQAAEKVGVAPRTWLGWELPSQNRRPAGSCKILLDMLESRKI